MTFDQVLSRPGLFQEALAFYFALHGPFGV